MEIFDGEVVGFEMGCEYQCLRLDLKSWLF